MGIELGARRGLHQYVERGELISTHFGRKKLFIKSSLTPSQLNRKKHLTFCSVIVVRIAWQMSARVRIPTYAVWAKRRLRAEHSQLHLHRAADSPDPRELGTAKRVQVVFEVRKGGVVCRVEQHERDEQRQQRVLEERLRQCSADLSASVLNSESELLHSQNQGRIHTHGAPRRNPRCGDCDRAE